MSSYIVTETLIAERVPESKHMRARVSLSTTMLARYLARVAERRKGESGKVTYPNSPSCERDEGRASNLAEIVEIVSERREKRGDAFADFSSKLIAFASMADDFRILRKFSIVYN